MSRWEKDRLIGAVRLEYGNGGLMAVRRRGKRVILSGIFPGGVLSMQEALHVAQLLRQAASLPIPIDAQALAAHWISPPEMIERTA